jgi:hypothetical protein
VRPSAFFFFSFVYVTLHMHDIQRATTRRQLTQHPKTIPGDGTLLNELAIAKRTESKEAKAHAFLFLWLKQKTYVFDGRDPGVWGFMGAVRMRHSPLVFNYQFHVGLFAQMSASPDSILGCGRLPHSGGHSANDRQDLLPPEGVSVHAYC